MSNPQKIGAAFCILLLISLIFVAVDCSCGSSMVWESEVIGKEYKPAWTEVTTRIDADGNTRLDTTHHPEEYHVICNQLGGDRTFDVSTSRAIYHQFTNGQYATVTTRQGRWLKFQYLPSIKP